MHYEIDYGPLIAQEGEDSAKRKACRDAVRYVGQPAARAFFRGVRMVEEPEQVWKIFSFLSGVTGFPARALYERAMERRKRAGYNYHTAQGTVERWS